MGLRKVPAALACITHLMRSTGAITKEVTAPEMAAARQSVAKVPAPSGVRASALRAAPLTKKSAPLMMAWPAIVLLTPP